MQLSDSDYEFHTYAIIRQTLMRTNEEYDDRVRVKLRVTEKVTVMSY